MMFIVLLLLSAAVAFLVLWVEGIHQFAIWNLTPVIVVAAVAIWQRQPQPFARSHARAAWAVFCVSALALVTLLHLAWQFDWRRTATGSSTSGLIFIFAPVYTLVLAAAAAGLAWATIGVAHRFRGGR
jgi:hypothetical protein